MTESTETLKEEKQEIDSKVDITVDAKKVAITKSLKNTEKTEKQQETKLKTQKIEIIMKEKEEESEDKKDEIEIKPIIMKKEQEETDETSPTSKEKAEGLLLLEKLSPVKEPRKDIADFKPIDISKPVIPSSPSLDEAVDILSTVEHLSAQIKASTSPQEIQQKTVSQVDAVIAQTPTEEPVNVITTQETPLEIESDDLKQLESHDWEKLMKKHNINESETGKIQLEYTFPKDQAKLLLRKWAEEHGRSEDEKLEDIFGFSKSLIKSFNQIGNDETVKILLKSESFDAVRQLSVDSSEG